MSEGVQRGTQDLPKTSREKFSFPLQCPHCQQQGVEPAPTPSPRTDSASMSMTLGHDPLGSSKAQPLTLPTATAMPGSTGERVDRLERELEKAHDSLDGINTFTKDVAKLDVQTARKNSLVFFVKGALI